MNGCRAGGRTRRVAWLVPGLLAALAVGGCDSPTSSPNYEMAGDYTVSVTLKSDTCGVGFPVGESLTTEARFVVNGNGEIHMETGIACRQTYRHSRDGNFWSGGQGRSAFLGGCRMGSGTFDRVQWWNDDRFTGTETLGFSFDRSDPSCHDLQRCEVVLEISGSRCFDCWTCEVWGGNVRYAALVPDEWVEQVLGPLLP